MQRKGRLMPSKRKFFKTILTIEVVSESKLPTSQDDLADVLSSCDCSWEVKEKNQSKIGAVDAVAILKGHGTDPFVLYLDEHGNDDK